MIDFYGISREKVALLPFGVDDSHIDISEKDKISKVIRKNIGFSENDFVIISGGKIDRRKNTINLMKAVIELKNPKVKLLVFGSINQDIEDEFLKLSKHSNIVYISWLDYKEIFRYFFAADLAVFPGTHSVMWEQAVGLGIPCIFKRWEYIDHIDLEGNCEFIENGSKEVISKKIDTIVNNAIYFSSMKKSAEKGLKKFLYSNIARRSIES